MERRRPREAANGALRVAPALRRRDTLLYKGITTRFCLSRRGARLMLAPLVVTLLWLFNTLVELYIVVIIAAVVVSWLVAFGVLNTYNPLARSLSGRSMRSPSPCSAKCGESSRRSAVSIFRR